MNSVMNGPETAGLFMLLQAGRWSTSPEHFYAVLPAGQGWFLFASGNDGVKLLTGSELTEALCSSTQALVKANPLMTNSVDSKSFPKSHGLTSETSSRGSAWKMVRWVRSGMLRLLRLR